MKIVVAYNKHRHGGGSDVVASRTIRLLSDRPGIEVVSFVRDSGSLSGFLGNLKALVSGCYSLEAVKSFSQLLDNEQPDLVHAHEVYPLVSPWIFRECKKKNIPVVMTCHDYRLACPIATHFRCGELCYECPEHTEFRCIQNNCCGSIAKSIAYAARSYIARKKRLFLDGVDLFVTPSRKAKEILCRHSGVPDKQVVVVGNPAVQDESNIENYVHGDYVGYVGRFEPEKGFEVLVDALVDAGLQIKVAGSEGAYGATGKITPEYVEFLGHMDWSDMDRFYRNARMIVVPSICHETFGLVVAEALFCGTPVVVSDLGALAEVAGPGGLSIPAGSRDVLHDAVVELWNNDERCRQMAEAGREHVKQFSNDVYVNNIIKVYRKLL